MNYIILHDNFSERAGIERVIYNLLEFFSYDKNNNIILLLCDPIKNLVFDVEKLPIKIDSLNIEKRKNNSFSTFRKILNIERKLKSYIQKNTGDEKLVIISSYFLLSFSAYLSVRKRSNIQIVGTEHFAFSVTGKPSRAIRSLFYRKINIVTLTEHDKEIIKEKYKPKLIECIPNALPFEAQKFNLNNNKLILSIGRITQQKGFDLLVEAFGLLNNEFPDWKLIIIGDDYGDKTLVENIIKENKIRNVEIKSSTPKIEEYYKEATFYVMSSRFEGLPMVLIEALGFGLPIVAFDCPTGPSDIMDDSCGFLVNNGNIDELAHKMKLLMQDRNLLLEKAKGAEYRAQYYSKNMINQKWKEFINNIEYE